MEKSVIEDKSKLPTPESVLGDLVKEKTYDELKECIRTGNYDDNANSNNQTYTPRDNNSNNNSNNNANRNGWN